MSVLTPILKKVGEDTPSKSQKVHFAPNIRDISNFIETLSKHENEKSFKDFVEVLISPLTADAELQSILLQLRDNVILLEKDYEIIVSFILKINWASRTKEIVAAYQALILNLISAHTSYISPVLDMLVSHFFPKREDKTISEIPTKDENYSFQNSLSVIQEMLRIVPSSSVILLRVLQKKFPYIHKESYIHVCFLHNLLAICKSCPELRAQILELILSKLLQIDVHCSPQDIMNMEENGADNEEIFDMESDETCKNDENIKKLKHPLGNTLDCYMDMIFSFIHSSCHTAGELNWEETKKLYKELLFIFDKLILPTFGSVHIQFIMFFILSFKPALYEGFLDYLWKKVQNPNTASIIRQSAVSYISGLLTRATYISVRSVISCFDIMCPWINSYIDNQEETNRVNVDVIVHGSFYAICQAIFYVFAFRQKELTQTSKSIEYLRNLNFERMVTSRLNPLKVCNSVVVRNFANFSRSYQLAYCHTIIERNNRQCLPIVYESDNSSNTHTVVELPSFFPFDQYILVRSRKYIIPFYREYQGNIEIENIENKDEDDFLDMADQNMMSTSGDIKSSLDEMFSYKFSPGFHHIVSPTN